MRGEPVTIAAPWRAAFVKGEQRVALPSPSGCIFCDYPLPLGALPKSGQSRLEWDRERLVVTVREHAFVIMNRFPYAAGHVMVIPRLHGERLDDRAPDAFFALHHLLHETIGAVRDAYGAHGLNVGMNMGEAGGAGIPGHAHYHVVPRWRGDTNFMPMIAGTRVLSDSMEAGWEALCQRLRRPADDADTLD